MSDLLDHPAAIRQGEELDLATLELYLRRHFPTKRARSRPANFRAVIPT